MAAFRLQSPRLELVLRSAEEVRAWIGELPAEVRAEVSPDWLARIDAAGEPDPWLHGFRILLREGGGGVGDAGFKGAPGDDGVVEVAYGIDAPHQGRGYATEAAGALVRFALASSDVRVVRAHTRRENLASARVLSKCGFRCIGEVIDPEDGAVMRWETTSG